MIFSWQEQIKYCVGRKKNLRYSEIDILVALFWIRGLILITSA